MLVRALFLADAVRHHPVLLSLRWRLCKLRRSRGRRSSPLRLSGNRRRPHGTCARFTARVDLTWAPFQPAPVPPRHPSLRPPTPKTPQRRLQEHCILRVRRSSSLRSSGTQVRRSGASASLADYLSVVSLRSTP